MGNHERPRPGRHRKPSATKRIAGTAAVATTGTAAAAAILLGGPAYAATTSTVTTGTSGQTAYYDHLRHVHHVEHLWHLNSLKQVEAAPVTVDYHVPSGVYSFSALEELWREAGGSAGTEVTAACIAEHESGGNPNAESPTWDFGLWQIHGSWGPEMATFNPMLNAEAAVKISGDGTGWGAWTTAPDCGV